MARKTRTFVTFWGTRGSISTPGDRTKKYGGNTACVSIHHGKHIIIIDAGTGIRELGLELCRQAEETPSNLHLLLSHTHWDHIQGLPFFIPAYRDGTRLNIYGSPNKSTFLGSVLHRQMDDNYFPVEMTQLGADISIKEFKSQRVKIGPATIDWQEQTFHPGGSVRYRISVGGSHIVYASDVELDTIFAKGNKTRKNAAQRKEYEAFIKDADLLIADGQYTPEQYTRHTGFGHTSIPVLLNIAHAHGVKQLSVFHHEPQNSDSVLDSLWEEYAPGYARRKRPMNVFWAREGMTLAL